MMMKWTIRYTACLLSMLVYSPATFPSHPQSPCSELRLIVTLGTPSLVSSDASIHLSPPLPSQSLPVGLTRPSTIAFVAVVVLSVAAFSMSPRSSALPI
ncbi:hypothetical protein C8Q80DRAFT_786383 [Daedaleopsis nitida]|nr:hypothetical protein C8Q80DRAFT_786383 [Daedaleopsis nitida]